MADERDRTASERGQAAAENAHAAGGREGSADALEQLSTRELHDRAVRRAERHLDVRFFWSLLQMIPAAEAASGDQGEAASLGKVIGPSFAAQEMPDVVSRLIDVYVESRHEDERFIDTVRRLGIEPFKERVYAAAH